MYTNPYTECGIPCYAKKNLSALTYILIWEYKLNMARAATTTDVFNAVAEPRRREIIALLANGREWAVGDVVVRMQMAQPAVSKHLSVLHKVGVVTRIKRGQHRMYRLEAAKLKPIHDWAKAFEHYWNNQIDRIKERAEQKAMERIARENTKAHAQDESK